MVPLAAADEARVELPESRHVAVRRVHLSQHLPGLHARSQLHLQRLPAVRTRHLDTILDGNLVDAKNNKNNKQ